MEIPEKIRRQLLEQCGIVSAEDFNNMIYDLQKSSKAHNPAAAANANAKTKFTWLSAKTVDMVRASKSALEEFRSADGSKRRMAAVLREAEAVVGDDLKNVFCRKTARANKNYAIVKEEGNFYFKKENYKHALDLYSTALRLALVPPPAMQEWKVVTETPQGIVTETVVVGGDDGGGGDGAAGDGGGESTGRDQDASICLAARSAVHFQERDFEECIKDIDAATWFGCPATYEKKLEDRRKACEAKLKTKWAGLAKAAASPKGGASSRGVTFMALAEFENSEKTRLVSQYLEFCDPAKGKEERGRFARAKHDIEAGEILLVERPLCFCLAFSSSADNCHFCCRPLSQKTFLPSPLEEGVLLCSVDCLEHAMDGFHAWESKVNLCRLFEIADEDDMRARKISFQERENRAKFDAVAGCAILALRSILAHPLTDWLEVEKNLGKPPSASKSDSSKTNKSTSSGKTDLRYLAMNTSLSLLPSISGKPAAKKKEEVKENFETAEDKMKFFMTLESHSSKRDWQDHLSICSRALLLVKFLEEIGYLEEDNSREAKEAMGSLLVKIMEAIQYNMKALNQLELQTGELSKIGSALYPVIARYLNHSCDPNTVRVNLGNNAVVVARRNIRQGEEVTDGYGPHFLRDEKDIRGARLKEFKIKCSCDACAKDYPTLRYLEGDLKPGQANQVQGTIKAWREALDSKRSRKEDTVQAKLRLYHAQLNDYSLKYPHRSHAVGATLVATSFWQLLGNKKTD